MSGVARALGLVRSLLAWSLLLSPTLAWSADATLVQQIGEVSGEVAEAVTAEVSVVPFSPANDARTTPIILAPGKAFVERGRPGQVGGLSREERRAIRYAYDAGQTILLLDASVHDIEALHVLLKEGVTHQSSTDPVVLAYALRQENDIPTARIVDNLRPGLPPPGGVGPDFEDEGALQRAVDVVIRELTSPPVLAAAPMTTSPGGDEVPWSEFPLQHTIITSTSQGTYNTPVDLYALHSCQFKKDYYLVNTGGTWTATEAAFSSASDRAGQIHVNPDGRTLTVDWQPGKQYCTGGINVFQNDKRLCNYTPYPLWYELDIVPPDLPGVTQVNAAPAGDQGQSTSYSSGISFSLSGGVDISGDPSAGIQAGVTWGNEHSITVPPLVIRAGDVGPGNQGTFTTYEYCTAGTTVQTCQNAIQMDPQSGAGCLNYIVGDPQQGQTPDGRLSNVVQTVNWEVNPDSYGGSKTFDVTVTWQVNMAFSQVALWNGLFQPNLQRGPNGYCNLFGCSCSMPSITNLDQHSKTFNVPVPSSDKCSSG
jgi:hypothetical protein